MMSSRSRILFTVCILSGVLFTTGCLTSSDGDSDKNSGGTDTRTKKLSFPVSSLKLIEDYQVDLGVTIDPPASGGQWILWSFAWPESTMSFHTNAVEQPSLNAWPLKEGDLTLTATLYDSLEYKVLGELAPAYGSAGIDISVRKISVEITTDSGESYLEYTFIASTPHQDYLLPTINYEWDFGDNQTLKQTNAQTTTHVYEEGGTYIVSVKLSAMLQKGEERWIQIAGDTDTLLIQRPITKDLELVITPSDTVWNTASALTLQARPSLDRTEYPGDVTWMIDYGDGETEEFDSYLDDRGITHQYRTNGAYTLYVALHDPASGDLLAQDSAVITIGDLPFIMKSNYLSASVSVFATRHFGELSADGTFIQSSEESKRYTFSAATVNTLFWDNRTCTSEYRFTSGTATTTDTITATVSGDGSVVEHFEYTHSFTDTDYQGKEQSRITRFVLEQVPLEIIDAYEYGYTFEGMLAGGYVTHFEDWTKTLDPEDGTAVYDYMDNTDWSNSSQGEPGISISFERQ